MKISRLGLLIFFLIIGMYSCGPSVTVTDSWHAPDIAKSKSDNFSHLGYDFKFALDTDYGVPYVLIEGSKIFGKNNFKKSFMSRYGLGYQTLYKEFLLGADVTQSNENILNVDGANGEISLLKARVHVERKVGSINTWEMKLGVDLGINNHGDKKVFKIDRGESLAFLFSIIKKDDFDPSQRFVSDLIIERDLIRSSLSSQERYSLLIRCGKSF